MSIRNVNGEAVPLVGDGNLVPTPTPPPYATHEPGALTNPIKIYPTHNGVKRHVPLSESSKTDLHRATSSVNGSDPVRLAELLADPAMKAKIDHQDMFGFTALHMACQTTTTGEKRGQKNPDTIACAEILIGAGANVNIKVTDDQWGYTPLHFAVSSLYPQVEICQMLIDAGVDLCATDVYGNTPLHNAAMGTHVAQLKVLTKHPDWEKALAIKNKEGKTALQIAEEVVERQTKKVEKAPSHDECRMLLATGKGFEQLDEAATKKKASKKGDK